MSAAPVTPIDVCARRDARFHQLWTWLVSLGVCDCCAMEVSIYRVERELGDRTYQLAERVSTCDRRAMGRREAKKRCAETVRDNWASMPKAEPA